MSSIEQSGYPLVFKIPDGVVRSPVEIEKLEKGMAATRVYVRALAGMQKEAVVTTTSAMGTRSWRMVSDEGPYLNGTDLAPFPLAFFSAGLQFSFLSELLRHVTEQGVPLNSLSLSQDTFYTMNGSALQGTMLGGAKPVELEVKIEADVAPEAIARIVQLAEQSSPGHELMRTVLSNTFSLQFNDKMLAVTDVRAAMDVPDYKPDVIFSGAKPHDSAEFPVDIISKLESAEVIQGVEGGASSSLQPVQKRTLQIHGEAKLLEGTLLETTIQLLTPIGSTFRFVCDAGAESGRLEDTPSAMAYLSAGVGFCFMTQIGRYAHITKQALQGYQIIQDNIYLIGDRTATVMPFQTHTFLQGDEADEIAQETLRMSERTCFLHAAMRGSYPSVIRAVLNGEPLLLDNEEMEETLPSVDNKD